MFYYRRTVTTTLTGCDLFRVLRTDTETWEQRFLTYGPTDFATATQRARYYQQTFSRSGRYDYRVEFAG